HELVDHAGGAREAPAGYPRPLSVGSPSDVPGPVHLLGGPGPGAAELAGGAVLLRCPGSAVRPWPRALGAPDARGIGPGLRGVPGDDQAFGSRRLVSMASRRA